MDRQLLKYAGIGALIIVAFVAGILYWTRGAHIQLKGSIQMVRTQAMDERSSVVIVDFRFVNGSDYPFIVRDATVFLEDARGNMLKGSSVADVQAARLLEYFPLLGQKYNESLIIRDKVAPGESMDRMICARFEVSELALQYRRRLVIRIGDVDGAVSEIVEERPKDER